MAKDFSIKQKKLVGFTIIIFCSLLLAWFSFKTNFFEELENRSWDWRLNVVARYSTADPKIKIIIIDQNSLEHIAEEEKQFWPWPRELYVPIIEFLSLSQAKGVAFDILFTEQSHYSVHDDQALAASMAGKLPVVAAVAVRSTESGIQEDRLQAFQAVQSKNEQLTGFVGKFPIKNLEISKSVTLPILEVLNSAHALGNVNVPSDSDGIFRHIQTGLMVKNVPILTLPFALLDAANPKFTPNIPELNRKDLLSLRFAGPARSYKTYPFVSILRSFQQSLDGLEPQIGLNEFKDSYVFVGMDAPGLLDLRPTPLSPSFPGVEYHANALDNLINDNFISEAKLWQNLCYTLFFLIIAVAGALFPKNGRSQISVIFLCFVCLIASSYYAAILGYWIHLFAPLTIVGMAVLSAVALQYSLEGSQTRFIKKAFKFYVSPEVIDTIIRDPSILALGGSRKELSIFFSDIKGFTSISESMDPTTLVHFLNKFLSAMTSVILAHGGTVDKYVGDAIVAFWNAPIDDPEHARNAVLAANECQRKLDQLRPLFLKEYGHDVRLRIGVHSGVASVGNFGSLERFNYTVIGDAANLASRLEGANKSFATDVLISEATFVQLRNIACLKVAKIKVAGRDQAIDVYSPNKNFSSEVVERWNSAVALYEAGKLFEADQEFSHLEIVPTSKFYRERISKEINHPNWSPIMSLVEK